MPNNSVNMGPMNVENPQQNQGTVSHSKWHGFKVMLIRGLSALLRYTGISFLINQLAQSVFRSSGKVYDNWGTKDAPWGKDLGGGVFSPPSILVSEIGQKYRFAPVGQTHEFKLCKLDGIDAWLPGIAIKDFNRYWKVKDDPIKHNEQQTGSVNIMFDYLKGKVEELNPALVDEPKNMILAAVMTAMSQDYGAAVQAALQTKFPDHVSVENGAKEKYFDIKVENDLLVVTVFNPFGLMPINGGDMKFVDTYRTFTVDREGNFTPTSMRFVEE